MMQINQNGDQIQDLTNGDQDSGQDHGDIVTATKDTTEDTNITNIGINGDLIGNSVSHGDLGVNNQKVDLAKRDLVVDTADLAQDKNHTDLHQAMADLAHATKREEDNHHNKELLLKVHHHNKDHHHQKEKVVLKKEVHHLNGACMDSDQVGDILDMELLHLKVKNIHHHHLQTAKRNLLAKTNRIQMHQATMEDRKSVV